MINEIAKEIKKHSRRWLDIMIGYAPHDTKQFRETFTVDIKVNGDDSIIISFQVPSVNIHGNMNAIVLGLILNNKAGLLRTKNAKYAAAKTPTAQWFDKAAEHIIRDIENVLQ